MEYKRCKQVLKGKKALGVTRDDDVKKDFDALIEASVDKLAKFVDSKSTWAIDYVDTLQGRVSKLQNSEEFSPLSRRNSFKSSSDMNRNSPPLGASSSGSLAQLAAGLSLDGASSSSEDEFCSVNPEDSSLSLGGSPPSTTSSRQTNASYSRTGSLKDICRETADNQHFKDYIYAIKSLRTFERELTLLLEFIKLNHTGFSKIFKKFDKVLEQVTREKRMKEVEERLPFLLTGGVLQSMLASVHVMIKKTLSLKPLLPIGWTDRKVYTIGCFDLFHRGHANVLTSLREFGAFIVVGIHDDESYFKLKNKQPIDNLAKRMAAVKPYVDQIFVIPHTDPLEFIKAAVSTQDIEVGMCCYARGDDMLNFPSRDWVESVMPVHFLPRTEGCSSSLIRTIYHDGDGQTREKAAFAKTRYDGKPVDEDGNVIKTVQN